MKFEDIILTCIKEQPGISAQKIVLNLDKINNLIGTEETHPQASIFKQLGSLKKKGNLHNIGDRWYFMNRNIG